MSFSEFVMLIAASVSDIGRTLRETIGDMRSLFSTLDPDGDGSISGEEVAFGLRAGATLAAASPCPNSVCGAGVLG